MLEIHDNWNISVGLWQLWSERDIKFPELETTQKSPRIWGWR